MLEDKMWTRYLYAKFFKNIYFWCFKALYSEKMLCHFLTSNFLEFYKSFIPFDVPSRQFLYLK